jgi:predicted acylesterase/phospholipase RssA
MKETNEIKQVAIACQGGGSHTAFTAGALKRILKEQNGKYEITGLSGTSGGAICALLAWYGLLTNDKDKAIKLLDSFWREISARSFDDMLLNEWVVWTTRLHGMIPMLDISPYYYPPLAQERMRGILDKLIDFDRLKTLINDSSPDLLVGAADVLSGDFKVFWNPEINTDAILASAAIPTFLRAVPIDKYLFSWNKIPGADNEKLMEFLKYDLNIDWTENAKIEKTDNDSIIRVYNGTNSLLLKLNDKNTLVYLKINKNKTHEFIVKMEKNDLNLYNKCDYWDGLFSQNPPIRSFIEDANIHEKPDEIWIIQINPQTRHYEPKSIREIEDRRNELSGNLSLYQEIDFIENVNKWVDAGYLPKDQYKPIKVRWIERLEEDLDVASKLDRSPEFINHLMNHGEEQATEFLKQLT